MADFASFDLESLPPAEAYRLTVNTVVRRPIAWTVTKGRSGVVNAAPHSANREIEHHSQANWLRKRSRAR